MLLLRDLEQVVILCILCTPSRAFGRACPSRCNSRIGGAQWLSGESLTRDGGATGNLFSAIALCSRELIF